MQITHCTPPESRTGILGLSLPSGFFPPSDGATPLCVVSAKHRCHSHEKIKKIKDCMFVKQILVLCSQAE